ncbi:MAG: hypothetical protein IPO08_25110 [Xanthomonadales bacterium]|nr:hypothetical protein [Xanthomonadales bacterium]
MSAPVGNKNAARGNWARIALKEALKRRDAKLNLPFDGTLEKILDDYVEEAVNGNADTRRDLMDRMWGKPHQSVAIDGDGEGGPVLYQKVERLIVRPKAENPDSGSI